MTNKPRISIPITKNETVSSSSAQPRVSRPMWNPGEGAARQQEIEQARQKSWEDHQKQLADQTPLALRVAYLEGVVSHMQSELLELKNRA